MRALDKLRLRLRSLFRRDAVDRELQAELRYHLEQLTEEHVAAGMAPAEARAAALRAMGGVSQFEEECRDTRRMNLLDDLWKDARHAVRSLRRTPGFAAVAVLTLALGIGATVTIFSVVHAVLLRPLPFPEPERLVGVWHASGNHGPGTFFTYRDHQRVFEDLGGWEEQQVSITGAGEPERVSALAITDGTLPLLRVRPLLGRLFDRADDQPRAPARVLLTHGYWQRRFGGDPAVVGKTLVIDGTPAQVVGVLPAAFRFLNEAPAVLVPMQPDRADMARVILDFQVLARLKPGVTLDQANADLVRMIPLLSEGYGRLRLQPNVRPLAADQIGDVGGILWILLATVALVLLIACANVANLFLARAEGRHQELAVRAALGASRGRLTRQLLTESLLLGLAAGAVGLLLAQSGVALLRRLAPAALPRVNEIAIDPVVLVFALGLSLLTGLLFGLIPVARQTRQGALALKEGGRAATDGPVRQRTRNALVVAEVAMALVLMVLSGLMVRTFVALRQVEPGFTRPGQVQTFRIDVTGGQVPERAQARLTHERILRRLQQVPGVDTVGMASSLTMDGEDNLNPIYFENIHAPYQTLPPFRRLKAVAPGYFQAMGNRLVAGRDITWADVHDGRPVVLISERLAREYWRHPAEALGKRLRGPRTWREIVGVTGDERDDGPHQPATAIVYFPLLSDGYGPRTMSYAVRSPRVGSAGFLRELQQAVWSVDARLPLAGVLTLEQIQAAAMARTAFTMVMLALAATVALLLGLVGIYGVISYLASLRTGEIGIRMALGAQARQVRRLFLRHGLALAGAGVVLGLLASLGLTHLLSALLFGVGPMDPATYAAMAAVLMAVTLLATWLPARRASRIDPLVALRARL